MNHLPTLALLLALVAVTTASHRHVCTDASHIGRWWYNSCKRRCECEEVDGEYVWRCYRERKEFTCMSQAERQLFIDTYKTVSTPGHPLYPQYADLLARHATGFGTIHSTANFLPWHRWFAQEMEDLLQNVDCGVTLPWWDWSKKSSAPFVGSPFLDAPHWLGTNGVSGCVRDGPFDTNIWNPPNVACLNRNFGGTMPTSIQIANVLNLPHTNYAAFSDALEGQIHNTPHVRIGGTMVTGNSPDAPEFFMHHGFIDKLWNDWQKKSSNHLNAYSFNLNTPMPYAMTVTPGDVNDLKETHIKYVRYSSSTLGSGHFSFIHSCMMIKLPFTFARFNLTDIQLAIQAAPAQTLMKIPQLAFTSLTQEEAKVNLELARKSDASRDTLNQMIRKMKKTDAAVQRANRGRDIVDKFDDADSSAMGFDLPTAIEVLNIKPLDDSVTVIGEDDDNQLTSPCLSGEEYDKLKHTCVPVSCQSPSACPNGQKCIPEHRTCVRSPCPQFICEEKEVSANLYDLVEFAPPTDRYLNIREATNGNTFSKITENTLSKFRG